VAQLKQLNHMYGDHEVYGRQTIRVPVKRHGIVEELIRKEVELHKTITDDAGWLALLSLYHHNAPNNLVKSLEFFEVFILQCLFNEVDTDT
jgi:hypothetical protein